MFTKKEEHTNHDYFFMLLIAIIFILASGVVQWKIIKIAPCGLNKYEKDSLCIDCIGPLG